MDENHPAQLRAKINHYRQMMRNVDDPALHDALEAVIRLTQEKLENFPTPVPVTAPTAIAKQETKTSPATLGEVLYAAREAPVPEQEWATLVRSIASGEQLALHALYERVGHLVYTFGFRLSGRRKSAEELTVDVFHDLWCSASRYDSAGGTVLGWVMNQARLWAMGRERFETIDRSVSGPLGLLHPSTSLPSLIARRIADETGTQPITPPAQRWLEPEWEQVAPGIECKLLATDEERRRVSMVVRLAPDANYPAHVHAGVEELFLLDGELWIDLRKLFPGDYYCAAPGTGDERVWSETGCTCFLVTSVDDRLC